MLPDPRAVILEGTFRDLQMAIRPRARAPAKARASITPGPLEKNDEGPVAHKKKQFPPDFRDQSNVWAINNIQRK